MALVPLTGQRSALIVADDPRWPLDFALMKELLRAVAVVLTLLNADKVVAAGFPVKDHQAVDLPDDGCVVLHNGGPGVDHGVLDPLDPGLDPSCGCHASACFPIQNLD